MGTVELNCIFSEESRAKIAAPHAATTRAYLYISSPSGFYYGKQQMPLINNNAKTQFQLLAGLERQFKVIGYDKVMNINYQGISGSIMIEQNKTVQVTIHMKKYGMVSIPGGSFDMGSDDIGNNEKPIHTVTVDGFLMGSTEVTREQWDMFISWLEIKRDDDLHYYGADYSRPMRNVIWPHALSFCNFISELAGLDPCYNEDTQECDFSKNGYRLPTEAEWEYACRARRYTYYNTGDGESNLDRGGWYEGNSDSHEHPVGLKEPNPWGLYDMHGNVSEWCYDEYERDYYSSSPGLNPTGPELTLNNRVLRGGNFASSAEQCKSAYRYSNAANWYSYLNMKKTIGFRIVRRENP
ncbi:formylglycine-generating enzyme family protein [Candidatus Omnitrophota bacterium]